jgi:hypothetical protein
MPMKITKDLTGQVFNKLLVIRFHDYICLGKSKKKSACWVCLCECGKEVIVPANRLISNNTKSCGCLKHNKPVNTDIVGRRFGKLEVLRFSHASDTRLHNRSMWECRCDCGRICFVGRGNLINGDTKSCGCLLEERNKKLKGKGIQNNILPDGVAAFNAYIGNYKYRARKKQIDFLLSEEQFSDLIYGSCYYCGQEPSRWYPTERKTRPINGRILVNGVDRLDSSIGYVVRNCVSCCEICNKAKRDLGIQEFISWIKRIILYANTDRAKGLFNCSSSNC